MKKNLGTKGILMAGVLMLMVSGCGNTLEQGTISSTELHAEVSIQEHSIIQAGYVGAANNNIMPISTKEDIEEGEVTSSDSSLMAGTEIEDPQIVEKMADALKKYLDVTVNPSEFNVHINYFEGFEDIPAEYFVEFSVPENEKLLMQEDNIGQDGFPTEEVRAKLKPEYTAYFSDKKELIGLQMNYMNWEKTTSPIEIEEIKTISKDFLIKNGIAEEEKIELMAPVAINEERGVAFYQIGIDRAVIISINIYSGKVERFDLTTPERVKIIISPKEEGYGVG